MLRLPIMWNGTSPPSPPGANAGFLRPDAALFLIMVSDEDDKSFGDVGYYRRLFENYKGPGFENRISVSAIVGPGPDGCSSTRGVADAGERYEELVADTGGISVSICDDFTRSLESLSITSEAVQDIS